MAKIKVKRVTMKIKMLRQRASARGVRSAECGLTIRW